MKALLWKLHRWVGVVTCLALLLWGLSGVLHPIMSRLQPKPAQFLPPVQAIDLSTAQPLPEVLAQHAISRFDSLSLASVAGHGYYRVAQGSQAQLFDIASGQPLANGEQRYAVELARHYTGLRDAPVSSVRLISRFDDDYPRINRLLPVWRVEFAGDERLRAFVEPGQARLATLSSDTRESLVRWFRLGHHWSFIPHGPLKHPLLIALLLCVLFSALSGLYFYLAWRPTAQRRLERRPLARWHRSVGGMVALAALAASGSGLYHLLHHPQPPALKTPPPAGFSRSELQAHGWHRLTHQPLAQLQLARLNGEPLWLATPARAGLASGPRAQVAKLADEHAEHNGHAPRAAGAPALQLLTQHGMPLSDGAAQLAGQLARHYAAGREGEVRSIRPVQRFNAEYGFLFKRLPVYRVEFSGAHQPRYFVELSSGALAARIDNRDLTEGQSFAWLHKWSWLDPVGKDARDALLASFAAANVGVALLGLWLFLAKPRRRARSRQSQAIGSHSGA